MYEALSEGLHFERASPAFVVARMQRALHPSHRSEAVVKAAVKQLQHLQQELRR